MYNTEKYIGACLDSILAQTLTDYEVIVVDDCSTDESYSIVEGYQSKFGDKLKLIHLEKNSGSPGIPRNKGIELASGKYIYFVDSDDALTETALGEFYAVAEDFQADVVHTEKFFQVYDEEIISNKTSFEVQSMFPNTEFVLEPTLMSADIAERIKIFVDETFDWTTWHQFIRLDFLKKNRLTVPPLRATVDSIFAVYLLCLAEKIVRVPNIVYIYRRRKKSITDTESVVSPEERITRWGDLFFRGFRILEKFFTERKIFGDKPVYNYVFKIMQTFSRRQLPVVSEAYAKASVDKLNEINLRELDSIEDTKSIAAFLFDCLNLLQLDLKQYQQKSQIQSEIFAQQQDKLETLTEVIKKSRRYMNYQRVQIQNLKSVISSDELPQNAKD